MAQVQCPNCGGYRVSTKATSYTYGGTGNCLIYCFLFILAMVGLVLVIVGVLGVGVTIFNGVLPIVLTVTGRGFGIPSRENNALLELVVYIVAAGVGRLLYPHYDTYYKKHHAGEETTYTTIIPVIYAATNGAGRTTSPSHE